MSRCFGDYGKSVKPRRAFATEVTSEKPNWLANKTAQQRVERETWKGNFTTPEKYIARKLKMLRKDMYIEPTEEEIAHLKKMKTEGDIDRAVKTIIATHWA